MAEATMEGKAVKVLSAVFALTALLSGCAGESGTPAMGCGKI